jgi:hypothetical protein
MTILSVLAPLAFGGAGVAALATIAVTVAPHRRRIADLLRSARAPSAPHRAPSSIREIGL